MGLLQAYRMAIKSIVGNKGRSFLTMLGVIIGVASVISAVAFAQGSTANVTNKIQSLGTNLIQVSIVGRNSNRNLTLKELTAFTSENSDLISKVAPQISQSNITVKNGTENKTTTIIGTTPEYEDIKGVHVQSGRFIIDTDVDNREKVALVGTNIVTNLFGGVNPVGSEIKINGQVFSIVGVLQQKSDGSDQSDDDRIIIPVTSAQRLFNTATIKNFAIQAKSDTTVDSAMAKLTSFLTEIYKTNKNSSTFRVFSQAEMLSTLSSVTSSMMIILGGIAAISLIVGGIGIMNIMLVSVTERIREIGIRKALGAKKRSILIQFLIEAIFVTGIGGLIGVLSGISVIHFIIGGLNIVPEVYSPLWTILSFGISVIIGVVFGLFPAYKAASLDPIEALRTE